MGYTKQSIKLQRPMVLKPLPFHLSQHPVQSLDRYAVSPSLTM